MKREILSADNLKVITEGITHIDRFRLLLLEGETTALLGVNGAGKTILAETLAGLRKPDSGTVSYFGNAADQNQLRHYVSLIERQDHLIRNLTVSENIIALNDNILDSWFYRSSRVNSLVRDILKAFDLEQWAGVPVKSISVAVQHLLLMVKALLKGCKVVILNNIAAHYSDTELDLLSACILQMNQRRVSVLFMSNNWNRIFNIADQTQIIRDGKLVKSFWYEQASRSEAMAYATDLSRQLQVSLPNQALLIDLPNFGIGRTKPSGGVAFGNHFFQPGALIGLHDSDESKDLFVMNMAKEVYLNQKKHIAIINSNSVNDEFIMKMSLMDNMLILMTTILKRWHGVLNQEFNLVLAEEIERKLSIPRRYFELPIRHLPRSDRLKLLFFAMRFNNPPAIIMDNLTIYSDEEEKKLMLAEVNRLVSENCMIFYLSSDIRELQKNCPVVWSIEAGKIAQKGSEL